MKLQSKPSEGIYRRLSMRMYCDAKFMCLSPVQPSGQSLFIYLLTGPHTGPIPGVFVTGKAALAESLGWECEAFEKAFAEVIGQGLVEFDAKPRLWFIPNAIKHNMPANPNVVLSWRGPWSLLPECDTRDRIATRLFTSLAELSEAFGKAFEKACGKAFTKPLPKHPPKQEAVNSEQETGSVDTPPGHQKPKRVPSRRPVGAEPAGKVARLSPDWELPKSWGDWALNEYPDWTADEVRAIAAEFRDHFVAKTGRGSTSRDWTCNWRNWCRSDLTQRKFSKGRPVNGAFGPRLPLHQPTLLSTEEQFR